MSTADVLEIPKEIGPGRPASQGTDLARSQVVKIVVEGQAFELPGSSTTSSAFGRLRKEVDGSYTLPNEWGVRSAQFSVLLGLLQSSEKLDTFEDISSILTLSSPSRLDLPEIYDVAKESLSSFFPHAPTPHYAFKQVEEALVLAIEHSVKSIHRTLYYALITHSDIGIEDSTEIQEIHPILSSHPEIVKTCQHLQSQLISHFTPILFTVPTAGHMACTEAFAEHWMTWVISPVISDPDGGVSAPIEALEKICEIDWTELELCEECARDKREEWRGEVDTIWEKMDEWLSIAS